MAILQGTTITGTLGVTGELTGQGLLPLGSVIGVDNSRTGAYSLPNSGTVDDNGWMRADGSAIPGGNSVSGTAPNISDCRFIRGSEHSKAGCTGGADTYAICECNLFAHNHSYSNTQVNNASLNTSSTQIALNSSTSSSTQVQLSSNSGNYSAAHRHCFSSSSNSGNHSHYYYCPSFTVPGWRGWGGGNNCGSNTGSSGAHAHTDGCACSDNSASHTHNYDHGHSSHTHVIDHDHSTHTHAVTHDHGNHNHSTTAAGSACPVTRVPSYLNLVYLVRVN